MYRRTFFKVLGLSTAALAVGTKAAVCSERHGNSECIPTGIKLLDTFLDGGIPRYSHVVIFGHADVGKTAFLNRFEYESNLHRSDWGSKSPKVTLIDDFQDRVLEINPLNSRSISVNRFQNVQKSKDRNNQGLSLFSIRTQKRKPHDFHHVRENMTVCYSADLILTLKKSDNGTHTIHVVKSRYGAGVGSVAPFEVVCKNGKPFVV